MSEMKSMYTRHETQPLARIYFHGTLPAYI